MSDHVHTVWIKRKDTKVCVECGEVLGFEEMDTPIEEMPWSMLDEFAAHAMEGIVTRYEDVADIAEWSYDQAEAMITERRKRLAAKRDTL